MSDVWVADRLGVSTRVYYYIYMRPIASSIEVGTHKRNSDALNAETSVVLAARYEIVYTKRR